MRWTPTSHARVHTHMLKGISLFLFVHGVYLLTGNVRTVIEHEGLLMLLRLGGLGFPHEDPFLILECLGNKLKIL